MLYAALVYNTLLCYIDTLVYHNLLYDTVVCYTTYTLLFCSLLYYTLPRVACILRAPCPEARIPGNRRELHTRSRGLAISLVKHFCDFDGLCK